MNGGDPSTGSGRTGLAGAHPFLLSAEQSKDERGRPFDRLRANGGGPAHPFVLSSVEG